MPEEPFEMLKGHLLGLQRPGRYIDNEMNALHLPWEDARVRVVLLFPDAYELGMSNLGFQILYHALGRTPGVMVDRAYLPWPDAQDLMLERDIPLFAHESRRPVSLFDLVGITLQTELAFTNVLCSLRLSRIPLLASEREDHHPLIIGGGPCALNPAPWGPVFDALFMGEADQAIVEVAQVVAETRGEPRETRLRELGRVEGIFLPAFPRPVKRRVVSVDGLCHPRAFLVSHTEVSHQRLPVEIMRGCDRGCRFCHAGFTTRPVRERPAYQVLRIAREAVEATGHDTISLLSLSTSDHSQVVELIHGLVPLLRERRVTLSLPSIRAGSLSPHLVEAMKGLRRSGFTIAPEAGSQRLRQVINKGITRDQVVETARVAFENGWELVKLYFMMGLPTENDDDLREMADLAREVLSIAKRHGKRKGVHLSVAPFVPKPHTPFQWEPQASLGELEEKARLLRRLMPRSRGFNLDIHDPRQSLVEAVVARGDASVTRLAMLAYAKGCRMDQWHEWFNFSLWQEAIEESGVDVDGLVHTAFSREHPFPWDVVETGVDREFLWRERTLALEARETPRCRDACSGCGVCGKGRGLELCTPGEPISPPHLSTVSTPAITTRLRLILRRTGESALIAQNSFTEFFIRVLRREGLPLAYSRGYHPQARISFAFALPVGMESLGEPCELLVEGEFDAGSFPLQGVNRWLPEGAEVVSVERVEPGAPSLSKSVEAVEYMVELASPPLPALPPAGELEGLKSDPLITAVEVEAVGGCVVLRFTTKGENGRFARPYHLLRETLSLEKGEERLLRVVRERVVLGG